MLGQDPRFFPSDRSGTVWQRTGRAFLHTFITKNTNGKAVFAAGRVVGALSSGFIGQAWYPDAQATPGQAFARSGSAMGGYLASSVFAEFKPDLMALATRLFRSAPKQAASKP